MTPNAHKQRTASLPTTIAQLLITPPTTAKNEQDL